MRHLLRASLSLTSSIVLCLLMATTPVQAQAPGGRGFAPILAPGALSPAAIALPQAPPETATAGQSFGFNFDTQNFADAQIVRFEMQLDSSGTWADIQIPPTADDAATPAGSHTYKVPIPPLTPTTHFVVFRACNVTECGPASAGLSFKMVAMGAPSGERILGGS